MKYLIDEKQIRINNSAFLIFFFDEVNQRIINETRPHTLFELGAPNTQDPSLEKLAREGILAAYEVENNNNRTVIIAEGKPLTPEERRRNAWRKLQTTYLQVPSGTIRIHSLDTFVQGEESGCDSENLVFTLKPGKYRVSLYRIDPERAKYRLYPDMSSSFTDNPGEETDETPEEMILFTPVKTPESALPAGKILKPHTDSTPWRREYTIVREDFYGTVIAGPEAIWVNFDFRAAEKLKLTRGDHIQLRVGEEYFEAVFLSWVDILNPWYRAAYNSREFASFRGPRGKTLAANWGYPILGKKIETLRFMRFDWELGKKVSETVQAGEEACICILEHRFNRIDTDWLGRIKSEPDRIQAEVLACNNDILVINSGAQALKNLGLKPGGEFQVEVNGQKYQAVYCLNQERFNRQRTKDPKKYSGKIHRLENELKKITNRRNWIHKQLFDSGEFSLEPAENALLRKEHITLKSRAETLESSIRELRSLDSDESHILGGILLPHWDLPKQKVLALQPLHQGLSLSAERGMEVHITIR